MVFQIFKEFYYDTYTHTHTPHKGSLTFIFELTWKGVRGNKCFENEAVYHIDGRFLYFVWTTCDESLNLFSSSFLLALLVSAFIYINIFSKTVTFLVFVVFCIACSFDTRINKYLSFVRVCVCGCVCVCFIKSQFWKQIYVSVDFWFQMAISKKMLFVGQIFKENVTKYKLKYTVI